MISIPESTSKTKGVLRVGAIVAGFGVTVLVLAWTIVSRPLGVEHGELVFAAIAGAVFLTMIRKRTSWLLYGMVLFLPFIQAPTLKFLFRVRLSEILAWMLFPQTVRPGLARLTKLPGATRMFVGGLALYFTYVGAIGLVSAPFLAVDPSSFAYGATTNPTLRPLLESARGLAAVILVIGVLTTCKSWTEFRRLATLFVLGGAVASIYGIYQTTVLGLGLDLPILPGTLSHDYARPFGTFSEPTRLGSFLATTTIVAAYLVLQERGKRRIVPGVLMVVVVLGLFMSLGKAGWIGAAAGFAVLTLLSGRKIIALALTVLPLMAVTIWVGIQVAEPLLGRTLEKTLRIETFTKRAEPLVPIYTTELRGAFLSNPQGVGQGNWLLTNASAPGVWRLAVEGGIPGVLMLIMVAGSGAVSILRLLRSRDPESRSFAPFAAAAYTCTFVLLFNYGNTTDMWLWFTLALPVIGRAIEGQRAGEHLRRGRPEQASQAQ